MPVFLKYFSSVVCTHLYKNDLAHEIDYFFITFLFTINTCSLADIINMFKLICLQVQGENLPFVISVIKNYFSYL